MLDDEMTGAGTGAGSEAGSGAVVDGAAASGEGDDENSLVPRLKVIEEQQLDQRAAAFAQIHDRLQQTLEGSDVNGARG